MSQAIVTKYLAPTNSRGARIVASAFAGKVTIPWSYAGSVYQNHRMAALRLAEKLRWDGEWTGGSVPGDTGYAFVRVDAKNDGFNVLT